MQLLEGPVLAPMVRAGFTSMRLLCVDYGASCVFTDVVIASNIVQSNVFECEDSVLFVRNNNRVLRLMKRDVQKTIVQLAGTSADVFVRAAEKVAPYCAGIDINCGCTKDWTHQCMGAGLLKDLRGLVELAGALADVCGRLGKTSSVKIRLLDSRQETVKLIEQLFQAKISFISIHMRYQNEDREISAAHWDEFKEIYQQTKELGPIIANGDLITIQQIEQFKELFNSPPPIMIARGAVRKPSIFQQIVGKNADSTLQTIQKLFSYSNTKNYQWKLIQQSNNDVTQLETNYLNQYKFNEFKTAVMFMLQIQKKTPDDIESSKVKLLIQKIANLKNFDEFEQAVFNQ